MDPADEEDDEPLSTFSKVRNLSRRTVGLQQITIVHIVLDQILVPYPNVKQLLIKIRAMTDHLRQALQDPPVHLEPEPPHGIAGQQLNSGVTGMSQKCPFPPGVEEAGPKRRTDLCAQDLRWPKRDQRLQDTEKQHRLLEITFPAASSTTIAAKCPGTDIFNRAGRIFRSCCQQQGGGVPDEMEKCREIVIRSPRGHLLRRRSDTLQLVYDVAMPAVDKTIPPPFGINGSVPCGRDFPVQRISRHSLDRWRQPKRAISFSFLTGGELPDK